jgi:hypothetical protein
MAVSTFKLLLIFALSFLFRRLSTEPFVISAAVSWKEFIAKYETARVEKAERFEATCEALKEKFGKVESLDKAGVAKLVEELESSGDLQLGFANSIKYQTSHSAAATFSLKDIEAMIQKLTFADKPASSGLGSA